MGHDLVAYTRVRRLVDDDGAFARLEGQLGLRTAFFVTFDPEKIDHRRTGAPEIPRRDHVFELLLKALDRCDDTARVPIDEASLQVDDYERFAGHTNAFTLADSRRAVMEPPFWVQPRHDSRQPDDLLCHWRDRHRCGDPRSGRRVAASEVGATRPPVRPGVRPRRAGAGQPRRCRA